MPSSVLLAIMVGSGVLALLPALVRKYDAAVRGQVELRASSMRVLRRRRRQRTVPGAAPRQLPSAVTGAVRTTVAVDAGVSAQAAARAALVREALADRDATRVRVSRVAVGAAGNAPVSAVPLRARAGPPGGRVTPARRALRRRRRLLLCVLVLLVAGQVAGALLMGPAFWVGAVASATLAAGYLVRLRVATARSQRRQVAERARLDAVELERRRVAEREAERAADRARRHRAEAFVRRALEQAPAGPGLQSWLGGRAVRETAAWLALPRLERRRPHRDVVRVLAAAGREVARADDQAWIVRPVVRPVPPERRAVPRPSGADALPRVANG